MKSIESEVQAFKKLKNNLKSKNLIKIYDIFLKDQSLYIVMEYCRHGDLDGLMKKK